MDRAGALPDVRSCISAGFSFSDACEVLNRSGATSRRETRSLIRKLGMRGFVVVMKHLRRGARECAAAVVVALLRCSRARALYLCARALPLTPAERALPRGTLAARCNLLGMTTMSWYATIMANLAHGALIPAVDVINGAARISRAAARDWVDVVWPASLPCERASTVLPLVRSMAVTAHEPATHDDDLWIAKRSLRSR